MREVSESMLFEETDFDGVWVIVPERHEDERGFHARAWCAREVEDRGLDTEIRQCNISFNPEEGTLRGLHYQAEDSVETKIIRCTMGALYDVVVDLRPGSATFRHWISVELNADNRRMIYVPKGLAHGFLTRMPNTEVFYQMSAFFSPEHSRGVRYDDPAFAIKWPGPIRVISERDRGYSDFEVERGS